VRQDVATGPSGILKASGGIALTFLRTALAA
jgi:hypothetical protein